MLTKWKVKLQLVLLMFTCCCCREVLAHLLLGRGQGGSGWAWCSSTLRGPAHVQGLDLDTALCPVASGAQGNLDCSGQAPHPAQPALGQPHLYLCSPGASAPLPESVQVSALPHVAQGSQSLSVCISPLSGDLMVSSAGAGSGWMRTGMVWKKSPMTEREPSIVTASMGGMAEWCTDWALCMCLRTLNAKTPMGAWGLRWQCSSPMSARCTVKSSDPEGELYCWNKHGNCSLAPPHRRIPCVQANGLSVLEGYVCFLSGVTEEKEIEHLVAADLLACECRIFHWRVIVLLPEWSTDPVVMP